MRVRPQHVIIGAVVALMAILLLMSVEPRPGDVKTDGDTIRAIVNDIEPNATATFDIVLLEGNDAKHESSHIFGSLQHPAIATLTLNTVTLTLEVAYDGSAVTEASIRRQLVASGYIVQTLADATPATVAADGASQSIHLVPSDVLVPSFIRAKAGVPLTLTFSAGSGHLASVTIPALGIEQDITIEGAAIQISAPVAGEYEIVCAEGYTDATLVIE